MIGVNEAIEQLKIAMKENNIESINGLGTELFLFTTTLIPIVNIDILVVDNNNHFLLLWREDEYCGKEWHILGGCMRLKETMQERIHACAIEEFGVDVDYISEPIMINEDISNQRRDNERCHFVSILYICKVENETLIRNVDRYHIERHLKWFDEMFTDMVPVQDFYVQRWKQINRVLSERDE